MRSGTSEISFQFISDSDSERVEMIGRSLTDSTWNDRCTNLENHAASESCVYRNLSRYLGLELKRLINLSQCVIHQQTEKLLFTVSHVLNNNNNKIYIVSVTFTSP